MNSQALISFLKFDIKLQWRRGLFLTYLVVILFYTAVLHQLPIEARRLATVVLLFVDSSMLGFFFLGALVQWEREEHLYEAMFTTPFADSQFLFCRTLSLSLLTLVMSLVLVLFSIGLPPHPLQLALGIFGGAAFFVLFGYPLALKTGNIIGYFLTATVYTLPLVLPLLELFGVLQSRWFLILPTGGMLALIRSGLMSTITATGAASVALGPVAASAALLLWIILMAPLSLRLSRSRGRAAEKGA